MRRKAENVAPSTMPERVLQDQVVKLARLRHWMAYHTYSSRRSAPGFPDLVLVERPDFRASGRGRALFVELKSQDGRCTEDQLAWIEAMRFAGLDARIWRPGDWDEIEATL